MADQEQISILITGDNAGLTAALQDSRTKVKALGADLERGGENVKDTFTQATVSLSDLDVELGKTKTLTDEQAAEIKGLSREYAQYATQAGEAAGVVEQGSFRQINSLSGLASALGKSAEGAAAAAGGAIAVGEAFSFGYSEGTKLRGLLNDLSDGAFDDLIRKTPEFEIALAALAPAMDTDADRAQLLTNQLNILRKAGIDATGLSAEQVQAKVDQLGTHMRDLSAQFTAQRGEIVKSVSELMNYEEAVRGGGDVTAAAADRIVSSAKEQIKAIEELPKAERAQLSAREAALREFVSHYEGFTTEHANQVRRQIEAEEKLRQTVAATLGELTSDQQRKTAIFVEETNKLIQAGGLTVAQHDRIAAAVRAELDLYDSAGKEAPADLASIAEALNVVSTAAERAQKATEKSIDSLQKALEKARAEEDKARQGSTSTDGAKLAQEAERLKARIAELDAQPLKTAAELQELFDKQDQLRGLNDELGRSVRVQGDLEKATEGWGRAASVSTEQANALQQKITETNNADLDLSVAMVKASEAAQEQAVAAGVAANGLSDAAIKAERLADGTLKLTNTYGEQAVELKRNADGFLEIDNAAGKAGHAAETAAGQVSKLGDSVRSTYDAIKGESTGNAEADHLLEVASAARVSAKELAAMRESISGCNTLLADTVRLAKELRTELAGTGEGA